MNTGKACCGLLLLATLAFSVVPAQAQPETRLQAKERCEKAARLYDLGRYGEAIQEYEAAYLLVPDPNLLYNIGQAYRLWDKPEEAVRSYKNYLRNRENAPNRAEVEKRIVELERAVEIRHRSEAAPPAPASGPSVLEASAGASSVAAPAGGQPAGTVVQSGPSWLDKHGRVMAYALFSAGGACLVTSLVSGLIAANKAKQIADASKQANHPVFDPSLQSAGKTANVVAIATGLTGLALGGAGLYFYLRSRHGSAPSAAPGTEVAFFPLATPGFGGAGARVDF